MKPKFYANKQRGRLLDDEKVFCDVEQEFLDLMNKYTIPYEYDSKDEIYTIYGYKLWEKIVNVWRRKFGVYV